MNPELPEADDEVLDNPYQYTDYKDEAKRAGGEARVLGEPLTDRGASDDGRTRHGTRLRRGAGPRAGRPGLLRRRATARCR